MQKDKQNKKKKNKNLKQIEKKKYVQNLSSTRDIEVVIDRGTWA